MADGEVVFENVAECYHPDRPLEIICHASDDLQFSRWDWVGIYTIGWMRSNQYFTYQYTCSLAGGGGMSRMKATFPAKSLPHDQGEYQFCYYSTTKGAVYGSSGPFVFKSMDSEYVEEEIAGDDMIFVMSTTEVLREKIHTLEEKISHMHNEQDVMTRNSDELVDTLSTKEQELCMLDVKLKNELSRVDALQDSNCLLERTVSDLQNALAEVHKERYVLTRNSDELVSTLSTKEQELCMLDVQLKNVLSRVDAGQDNICLLERTVSDLQNALAELQAEMKQLLAAEKEVSVKLGVSECLLESEKEALSRDNECLRHDLKLHTAHGQKAQTAIRLLESDVAQLSREEEGLFKEVDRLKDIIAEKDGCIEMWRMEGEKTSSALSALEATCVADKQRHVEAYKDADKRSLDSEMMCCGLRREVDQLDGKNKSMQSKLDEVSGCKRSIEDQLAVCMEEMARCQSYNNELKARLSSAGKEFSELRRKESKMSVKIRSHEAQISLLKDEVQCLQEKLEAVLALKDGLARDLYRYKPRLTGSS